MLSVKLGAVALAERVADKHAFEPVTRPRARDDILRLRDGTVMLGHFRRVAAGRIEFEVESIGVVHIEGSEVRDYLTNEEALRAYYRTLVPEAGGSDAPPIPRDRFQRLWEQLGAADADDAWLAQRALVRAGARALPSLEARLKEPPDAPLRIRRLVTALDADDVAAREVADRRLRELGRVAEAELRAAAKRAQSTEVRQRLRHILQALEKVDPEKVAPQVRRVLRALRILEEIASPGAQQILRQVAKGDPTAPTAREARRLLARLGDR